ncbi:pentatricopeptide repeat-containing protein At2g30780 [Argentina anserina]|uniref:pentatricopeptide repeat-containing protein At2g30780 n=1 Tax=Argentina anserina TaxID=57926 RepID=UPI0021767655|nr:pentatricopeptide repeat-containing protein At2g30780 [Potentilla anserina]XP_050363566.1 pentatricopeptide repeat-containing protein At2g30780 [Potentilla anserina]
MKRIWRLSDAATGPILSRRHLRFSPKPETVTTPYTYTLTNSPIFRITRDAIDNPPPPPPPPPQSFSGAITLFTEKPSFLNIKAAREDPSPKLHHLAEQLLQTGRDSEKIARVLEDKGTSEFLRSFNFDRVNPFLVLAYQLRCWPHLALEVFNWRRNQAVGGNPMKPEEYTKAITFAGKIKNVELARELFDEAVNKRLKTTTMYNALMSAYMFNGENAKCQSLFLDLKREQDCRPNIVSYNILISVFGRLMLVDHMEATVQGLMEINLSPNLKTYNNVIAAYVTSWMWDRMETTFQEMKAGPVQPDTSTYLLMLRGYAHSGNLEKMEEMYELVKDHVNDKEIELIRVMICAYCKSSGKDRVEKIHTLLNLIPEDQYRAWLHVLLIRVYAQEDCFEVMERSIDEAFERKTSIHTAGVMRSIIASYFRCKEVDRLAHFVKRAESARWRICRSLYHCKMVMYASEQRLEEMENVISEMACFNLDRTKKTLWILYQAYFNCGERNKVAKVLGLMWKHGYEVPLELMPS